MKQRAITGQDPLAFLAGGGEMGERTRAFDWSRAPVGPVADWPQSLKIAVRIMLNSRYPMFVWWGRGLTKFYNDDYIPMLGKRHPDALGKPASEVWSDVWPVVGPQTEIVLKEGRATWNEELLLVMERNRFTEEAYFTFSYSPVPDDEGSVGGVFCAVTEDTQRVLSQRRLRTLRALAEQVAEAKTAEGACQIAAVTLAENKYDLPFALLYLLDGEGRQAKLIGLSGLGGETPASPATVELESGDAPWPFRQVAETGKAIEVTDLSTKFGPLPGGAWPESPQRAVVLPMARPGQSRLAGFVVAGISPRLAFTDDYQGFLDLLAGHVAAAVANARAYEEERQRAEALAEIDRAKTAFFSNVSHEFRTPLTLMLGPVEDLLSRSYTDLPPAAKGQLEVVNRNGLRLLRLVNTLLDFSRIEAGRVRAVYQPTDLAAFTAELASNFRSACDRAGLSLVVDCPRLPEPVYVDRDMWEKMVLNLVSNAFKFTTSGGIFVTLQAGAAGVELTIRDTGIGIPAEEMPFLFDRFHRVANAQGRTQEGSGIGLALVQELVKLHGGSVAAESSLGRGTTFIVTVPLGSAHLPPDQIGGGRTPASTATGASPYVEEALRWLPDKGEARNDDWDELPTRYEVLPVPYPEAGPKDGDDRPCVLVADDNTDMRQYIVRLLAERYQVEAVADGEAALAAVRRRTPDLILTDVMMSRLDGFGLLRELRADPRTCSLPVIMLSARAGEESRVEGMEAGADDYLVKPFSARELLARVSAHVEIARVRREAAEALREADRRKDEFLATLSHELRNPLAPLRNGLQVMKLARNNADAVDQAHSMMERQLGQMIRLIDDLLDVSRISRGKVELRKERVELARVVQNAVETARPLIEQASHELTVRVPPGPIYVDADVTRLAQVFANLLTNAAKFTERGGLIWLTVERQGSDAVVRVRDNGVGIPAHMLSKVFDMFMQVDRSLEKSQGGLGIGLTLVKRLVEMHSGSIEAKSDGHSMGCEFVVRLPVVLSLVGEQPPADAEAVRPAARRRILIVDDNKDAATSLAMMLKIMGNATQTAYDGLEALQVAAAFRPDVALLDIGMPKLNGYDAARRIREQPWGRNIVLVALSGWGQEEDKRRSEEAGFNLHMVKPVEPAAFEKLLASLTTATA